MFKRLAATATVLTAVTTTALAGPFEDGLAAYERDDFATALGLWLPLAELDRARQLAPMRR